MGTSAVQFKIMPETIDTNLEELKEKIKQKIEEMQGVVSDIKEEPIAFGLKALIVSFAYPEEKEIDELEKEMYQIQGISSVQMIDYRRAIG